MLLRLVPAVAISFVIAFYLLYNFFFSVNFPFQDDFLLIQFIEVVSSKTLGFTELIHELFRTFNDHKAVVPRLISLIEYHLTGQLNFRFYIVLVLINVVYIFSFILIQFRKTRLPLYLFVPAAFLFFHPLYHEVSGWALNGMQHSFLTAFTLTAILLVSGRMPGRFYLAMLCCFLATFTHGNGILSFPAIVFYFLCTKDLKKAGLTCVFMFACLAIYLIGYESGQAVSLPTSVASFLTSFLGFIGSEVSLWAYPEMLSVVWGLVITGFMMYLLVNVIRRYFNSTITVRPGTVELLTLFAFIVVTSLVIALFRSWAGSTIASRFQLYAALSTTIFYILLVDHTAFFKRKAVWIATMVLSVGYWGYAHYYFTGIVATKKTTYLADVYNWSANRNMFSVERTIVNNADFYLKPAYRKGFFHLPRPVVSTSRLDSLFASTTPVEKNDSTFVEPWTQERKTRAGDELLRRYFITSHDAPAKKALLADRFLVLRSVGDRRFYLLSANPKVEGRKAILKGGSYYKPGFNAWLRSDDLNLGSYELGVLDVEQNGNISFDRLGRILKVEGQNITLIDRQEELVATKAQDL